MINELRDFIAQNELSPFNPRKSAVKQTGETIFRTKDAKAVATKTFSTLSQAFSFSDTANLWLAFPFTHSNAEITKRQEFFKTLQESSTNDASFLKNVQKPRPFWYPSYSVVVVTEDESTFTELQKLDCASKYLVNQHDVESLQNYDLVQVIDCDQFKLALEQLPQSFFIDSVDDVYLERFVSLLSGWKHNLDLLVANPTNERIKQVVEKITPLLSLIDGSDVKTLDIAEVNTSLVEINNEISVRMKELSIAGDALFEMLSKQKFPSELEKIIRDAIAKTGYPLELFDTGIPVKVDEEEVGKRISLQKANEFTDRAAIVRSHANTLRALPNLLRQLQTELLLFDFSAGIASYLQKATSFPVTHDTFNVELSANLFLDNAQPISFHLSPTHQCSILTGANSGGKTTLLEHALQLYVLYQLGLPTIGSFSTPLFTDIYYFAKNKGSMSKGAFETLLTQMNEIQPTASTLILADEIEAVTEPGVAGKMICATAQYFIQLGCYVVIATHLGHEIQKSLPLKARIDGIEAKGLDENFELLVDHNPVLGRLAHSTPELIVEKMASVQNTPYFIHLREALKK